MSRHRATDQSGFTVIEVMVAMVIMLVGLVGTLEILNQASATTSSTKAREGGVALQRELVEAARSIPYDQLTQGSVVAAIRTKPGFTTSAIGGDGWTIERRGIDFTMAIGVCSVDDPADGTGTHDGTFCASGTGTSTSDGCRGALGTGGDIAGAGSASGAQVGDCGIDLNRDGVVNNLSSGETGSCPSGTCGSGSDKNPEDYKRIVTLVRWKRGAGSRFALQSSTLPYPGLSGAPRTNTPTLVAPAAGATNTITTTDQLATFRVSTNRAAKAVTWTVDGTPSGSASDIGGGTLWEFIWSIGPVDPSSPTGPVSGEVVDGPYLIGARGYDIYSQAGPTRTLTVTLNRRPPFAPTGFQALHVDTVVDLQWTASPERDLTGYRVSRQLGSNPPEPVCPLSRATTCTDTTPPTSGTWTYTAYAYDTSPLGAERQGFASTQVNIDLTNTSPNPPATLSGVRDLVTGNVTLTWAVSPGDPDSGDSVVGYRVYRDGTAINDRYTGTIAGLSFEDTAAAGAAHTYYVAAVDTHGAESSRLQVTVQP